MKRIFISLLFFLNAIFVFSQANISAFRFGMTLDEASAINPNLFRAVSHTSHIGNWPVYIMQYLYNSELVSTIPNPLVDYTGSYPKSRENYVIYRSRQNDDPYKTDDYFYYRDDEYTLLFFDNKLVGIETYFNYTSTLVPELNQLYGNVFTVSLSSGDDARVWNNQARGRFIIWYLDSRTKQVVTYVDSQTIRNLCRITLEEYRASNKNPRNRLDW
jgi:hypothetical protein